MDSPENERLVLRGLHRRKSTYGWIHKQRVVQDRVEHRHQKLLHEQKSEDYTPKTVWIGDKRSTHPIRRRPKASTRGFKYQRNPRRSRRRTEYQKRRLLGSRSHRPTPWSWRSTYRKRIRWQRAIKPDWKGRNDHYQNHDRNRSTNDGSLP